MDITTGLIKEALSSCYLKTETAAVICSIFIEQKNEVDPQVELEFSNQDSASIHASVKSVVESLFLVRSRSTRVKVFLYTVKEGPDLFSCCINSFSICAVSSGLRISDTICSATVYIDCEGEEVTTAYSAGLLPVHMAYTLYAGRVAQISFDGPLSRGCISKVVNELVSACNRKGDLIKLKVEEIVNSTTNRQHG